jgi:hypothetical protein
MPLSAWTFNRHFRTNYYGRIGNENLKATRCFDVVVVFDDDHDGHGDDDADAADGHDGGGGRCGGGAGEVFCVRDR